MHRVPHDLAAREPRQPWEQLAGSMRSALDGGRHHLLAAEFAANRGHPWGNQAHRGARNRRFRSRLALPGAAGSTLGQPLNRLQNGCSASLVAKGGATNRVWMSVSSSVGAQGVREIVF